MSSPRFYCPAAATLPTPPALSTGVRVDLPNDAARHAARVLRLRAGDDLVLFDGTGGEYAACIASVDRDRVSVDVLSWRDVECEAPIHLTLVQALQSGEKMDMTVQKAVELGIARIVPVASRRSVVKLDGERAQKRLEHWRGVVASACEQCGRNRVPPVREAVDLDEWLRARAPTRSGVVLAPDAAAGVAALSGPMRELDALVGPEGGLTGAEVARAVGAGLTPVRLGPRVLRTETASVAALSIINALWGDFR